MKHFFFSIFLLLACYTTCCAKNNLIQCYNKQIKPLQQQLMSATFTEKKFELEHGFSPWQTTMYGSKGAVWCNGNAFYKSDSMLHNRKMYYSTTQFTDHQLLFLDYGDADLYPVTTQMNQNQLLQSCRYSPTQMLQYFIDHQVQESIKSNSEEAIYCDTVYGSIVSLHINTSNHLLRNISILSHDDLYGDVTTLYQYLKYKKIKRISIPTTIAISKYNYHVADVVELDDIRIVASKEPLLPTPANYIIAPAKKIIPEFNIEKYQDHLYFINCINTDDRVMVVELDSCLLVAEAPLSSENGELIIAKIKEIFPIKPIKFFVFGHHHPHYIGGLRAFIHAGATIISTQSNLGYVQDLFTTPHTLQPDSLELHPKKILIGQILSALTFKSSEIEIQIHYIGNESAHTNDYLIYYFPKQKLLFQDDLIWIKKEGAPKKASDRQAGLYNAIKRLGLDVETIIQSWPLADYGVKTVIPFADVEASMMVK
jgi:glyoxylase-like metal-dependent hydrolase (beta-lactamase superfamily II)